MQFEIEVEHRSGVEQTAADALPLLPTELPDDIDLNGYMPTYEVVRVHTINNGDAYIIVKPLIVQSLMPAQTVNTYCRQFDKEMDTLDSQYIYVIFGIPSRTGHCDGTTQNVVLLSLQETVIIHEHYSTISHDPDSRQLSGRMRLSYYWRDIANETYIFVKRGQAFV